MEVEIQSDHFSQNRNTSAELSFSHVSQELRSRLAVALQKNDRNRHKNVRGRDELCSWKDRFRNFFRRRTSSFSSPSSITRSQYVVDLKPSSGSGKTATNVPCKKCDALSVDEKESLKDSHASVNMIHNGWSGSLVSLGSIVGVGASNSSASSSTLCIPCYRGKKNCVSKSNDAVNKRTFSRRHFHASAPSSPLVNCNRTVQEASRRVITTSCQNQTAGESTPLPVATVPLPVATLAPRAHTQVDYLHHLVHDLPEIFAASFYWGVMDRYEAEDLLEGRPEGTFLLRDSAQVDFLFSVSFRRYSRTLHARIEHTAALHYTFDSYDETVYSSDTVCGLINHYKDPSKCMYFEPLMNRPLLRTFPLALEDLCRGVICTATSYDGVNQLPLPAKIRERLRYYHYKVKVGSRHLNAESNGVIEDEVLPIIHSAERS